MCAIHMFRPTVTLTFFRMSVCLRVLAGLLILFSLAPLQAQNNGTLTGSVVDQTGAAVPNAEILAISRANNARSITEPLRSSHFRNSFGN